MFRWLSERPNNALHCEKTLPNNSFSEWPLFALGFNRWMQHTRNCVSARSVADEAKTANLLHGKSESDHVGAVAER